MYCVKCGAELDEGVEKCPLCETSVLKMTDKENVIYDPEYPIININLYELKIKKVKKAVFLSFFTISIISILEVFFQNMIVYGEIKWGYYAIPSILIFDLMLFVLLNSHTLRQNLFLIFAGLTVYFLILDYGNEELTWSLRTGIPIVGAYYFVSFIFSFVWDKHKSDRIKIMNFFLFFVGIFLLILEFIISRRLSWSVWASVPLFVLNIMLRYTYKAYKEEFKKRLHL